MIESKANDARLEVRLSGPAVEGGRLRVDALIEIAGAKRMIKRPPDPRR
jgi:hypothetical protein